MFENSKKKFLNLFIKECIFFFKKFKHLKILLITQKMNFFYVNNLLLHIKTKKITIKNYFK